MPNSDAMISNSRAELIKNARESCNKNLTSNKSNITSAKRISPAKSVEKEKTKAIAINRIQSQSIKAKMMSIRLMILRFVAALAILVSVVVIDQFNFSYKNINSSVIKEAIQSNESADKVVDIVTKLTKDKIIHVFTQK